MKVTDAYDHSETPAPLNTRSIDIVAADGSHWEIRDSEKGLLVLARPHNSARLIIHTNSHDSAVLENPIKDAD